MSTFQASTLMRRRGAQGAHDRHACLALALSALAWSAGAHAVVTVGPHGAFPTIQAGVNAAIANGGDEVRVELKCFVGCPYVENVAYDTPFSIQLSGGWAADFQSQISTLGSPVVGTGSDAPIIMVAAHGSAIMSVNRFVLDGSSNTAGHFTRGLIAGAFDDSTIVIGNNEILHNQVSILANAQQVQGGAGAAVYAGGTAHVAMAGNTIHDNTISGADSLQVGGGGVYLLSDGDGHIEFTLNHVNGNFASNSNGGACLGGGMKVDILQGSVAYLHDNGYDGNAQLFCNHGSTGDAVDIRVYNSGSLSLYEEIWTNNRIASNAGVYEVYVEAHNSGQIFTANGLITNGTWGGLFAATDGNASIVLSNYTVSGNPAVGITASGSNTQIWNTLAWNNSADFDPRNGATFPNSLQGTDPHFVDAAGGNYRLATGSPAIDAGTNQPTGGVRPWDLDFAPRPYNGITDIGAYEYQGDPNDRIFRDGFD